ncbi:MAG: hypothetical protein F9K48_00425 [Candidatus Brocadia sp.]|nr:MAG: hypothetical protein F9K48_00425 [Candidatus Brocadia sp.]
MNAGHVRMGGVSREGYCILTGERPVVVKAGAMQLGWQGVMETLPSEAHRRSRRKAGERISGS